MTVRNTHVCGRCMLQLSADKLFSDTALQLLARKVASVSGDVRRALDIARRVVDIAESRSSLKELPLQPTTDGTFTCSYACFSSWRDNN
ncbi:hypothetical protein PR048_016121 [Dryococelus australis]|uniref:AAA lid domain-containing protein n=1 Tax=Dryococelus australis TaxID=614101 RepID=A0ABQ9HIV1_9NEOP|nr:hypothetical protein PR048_016121 [Dryococelus australis]